MIALSWSTFGFAQTGLNTSNPHPSAALEISSVNKGLLAPRLTTSEKNAIINPATGLIVYDKDLKIYTYFNGTIWVEPNVTVTLPARKFALMNFPNTNSPTGGGAAESESNTNFQPVTVTPTSIVSESGDGLITINANRMVFNLAGRYVINVSGTLVETGSESNIKGRIILCKNGSDITLNRVSDTYLHLPNSVGTQLKITRKSAVVIDVVAGDYILLRVKKDIVQNNTAVEGLIWQEMIVEVEKI